MPLNAFQPQGVTQLIAATTAPSAAVQLSTGNITGARIVSDGQVHMAYGSSSVSASIPTTAVPAAGFPLMFNSTGVRITEIFNLGPNAYLSFATTSGTANVWITPGYGT